MSRENKIEMYEEMLKKYGAIIEETTQQMELQQENQVKLQERVNMINDEMNRILEEKAKLEVRQKQTRKEKLACFGGGVGVGVGIMMSGALYAKFGLKLI